MRNLRVAFLVLAVLGAGVAAAIAQAAHTPDQAKAFVEKAVAFYKSEGRDKALTAFSDSQGQWVDGDLYIVVVDANDGKLTMLAHAMNKGLVGKPQIDQKDADGKAFLQDLPAALSAAGSTWVSYKWPNAATKKIASKKTFWEKTGDVIIGAGVYE